MPPKRPLRTLPVALATAKTAQTAAARRRPKPHHVSCTGRTRAGSDRTKQSNRKGGKAARWGSWRGGARGRGWHATKPKPWVDLTPRDLFYGGTRPLGRSPKPSNRPKSSSWTTRKFRVSQREQVNLKHKQAREHDAQHIAFRDQYGRKQALARPILT